MDALDFTGLLVAGAATAYAAVVTAYFAVAALKVVPVAASWGIRKVLSMIGR